MEGVGRAKAEVSFTSAVGPRGPEVGDKKEEFPSRVGVRAGLNTYLLDTEVPAVADLLLYFFLNFWFWFPHFKKYPQSYCEYHIF